MCGEDGKGPCDRQSVTYDIKCAECNDIYIGETSRSAFTRGKEHMKSLAKKEERSALLPDFIPWEPGTSYQFCRTEVKKRWREM